MSLLFVKGDPFQLNFHENPANMILAIQLILKSAFIGWLSKDYLY
jgi:hypothetical protein